MGSLDHNIDFKPPPLLNVTDNECSRDKECIPQESCEYFQEEVTRLEDLPIGSEEYQKLVADMQKLVCNKEEKGFCCSIIETNSIIGGPAEKCCRECRYHPRKKRCVSIRTGRCCPCSTTCGKRSSKSTTTTTTKTSTTATTTTTTSTTTSPTITTTKTSTTTTTVTTTTLISAAEPTSASAKTTIRSLISTVVDETTINPTFIMINMRPIWSRR